MINYSNSNDQTKVFVGIVCPINTIAKNHITIINTACVSKIYPVGIGAEHPRLSWVIISNGRETRQPAYHVLVSDHPDQLNSDNGNVWNSKIVKSDGSIQVEYAIAFDSGEKVLLERQDIGPFRKSYCVE